MTHASRPMRGVGQAKYNNPQWKYILVIKSIKFIEYENSIVSNHPMSTNLTYQLMQFICRIYYQNIEYKHMLLPEIYCKEYGTTPK